MILPVRTKVFTGSARFVILAASLPIVCTQMTENRRSDERISINLPAKWDGLTGNYEARIEDLSLGGCFVNTAGQS